MVILGYYNVSVVFINKIKGGWITMKTIKIEVSSLPEDASSIKKNELKEALYREMNVLKVAEKPLAKINFRISTVEKINCSKDEIIVKITNIPVHLDNLRMLILSSLCNIVRDHFVGIKVKGQIFLASVKKVNYNID